MDLRATMVNIKEFEPYAKDARIAVIIRNAKAMRTREIAVTEPVPTLATAKSEPR
jgi:hypothetical protein